MIRFKYYISENTSAETTFKNAAKIASYIKSEIYKKKYIEALEALEKAAASKEIYNSRFGEYKSAISNGIEYGYKNLFDEIKEEVMRTGQPTVDLWSLTSTSDITKLTKIYSKMSPKITKASEFMEAISGIPDAYKIMKSYVKSGRAPVAPKPGQFYKPMASIKAAALAVSFMREASDAFAKELRANITKQYTSAYDSIKNITDPKKLPRDSISQQVATSIFAVRGKGTDRTIDLIPGHSERISKLIENSINDIVEGFVSKSSSKLALILQKKDAPKSHEILNTNVNNGKVENTIKFEFNDGSKFTLESSVVFKHSSTGKFFLQYPTRFKNVIMTDGSSMRMPSEEKMIKDF